MDSYLERMLKRARGQFWKRRRVEQEGTVESRSEEYYEAADLERTYIHRLQRRIRAGEVEGNPFVLWAIANSNEEYGFVNRNMRLAEKLEEQLTPGNIMFYAGRNYAGVLNGVEVDLACPTLSLDMSLALEQNGSLSTKEDGFYFFEDLKWKRASGPLELSPEDVGVRAVRTEAVDVAGPYFRVTGRGERVPSLMRDHARHLGRTVDLLRRFEYPC